MQDSCKLANSNLQKFSFTVNGDTKIKISFDGGIIFMFSEDSKSFYKSVFVLVFPMAIQNLINVAVNAADVLMLGKVGDTVLSGASLAGQIQYIMTLIFFGLTSGSAVLTAQYWGRGETQTIEKILGIALNFSLVTAVIFTACSMIFPVQCVSLFTDEADVIAEGADYLRILSVSYIFISMTMIYLNVMRSIERVMVSTVVYLISLFSNIILNWLLIFGNLGCPELGIKGAAISTCTSRIIEFIIVFFYSKSKSNPVHFNLKYIIKHDSLLFKDFMKYSLPVMINELAWGAGGAMNTLIIGHLGKSAVAANSVAQVARQLATVVAFGVANATAIMIGKQMGAGRMKQAEDYGKRFVKLTIFLGVCAGTLILAIRPIIINFVNLTDEANRYLGIMLIVMSYFVCAQAFNTTMVVGVFRSVGDTIFGLIMDISTMWGCSILFGALSAFVFKLSVPVVYIILMSDEVIKIPLSFTRYRKKKWIKNVTR